MAIGLGFDAVNSEHNRRTLSRILAQPIYRDALLFGKFLAGLATLAISLVDAVAAGDRPRAVCARHSAGRRGDRPQLRVPPGDRSSTPAFGWRWRCCSRSCSARRRPRRWSTLGLWLLVTFIWPVLAGAFAQMIIPPDPRYMALGLQTPGTAELEQILARLSPSTLFAEVVVALLDPTTRALGPIYLSQLQGAVLGAPLPLGASVLIAWPQIVGMVATEILLFVIGYVIFQRQEVRA